MHEQLDVGNYALLSELRMCAGILGRKQSLAVSYRMSFPID